MSELPRELRELVAESRRAHEPDAARLLAVRSRIDTSTGANAEFDLAPPTVRLGRWWIWFGVGLMLVVGGLTWVGRSAPASTIPRPAPAVQGVEARVESALETPVVIGVESVPALAPVLDKPRSRAVRRRDVRGVSAPVPPRAADVVQTVDKTAAAPVVGPETNTQTPLPINEERETSTKWEAASSRTRVDEAAPSASLQEEVKLISRARKALADGDRETAERALAQHRSEYPAGQLHAERVALMTRARCVAGDLDGARQLHAQLKLLGAGSSLVRNVERTCPQLGR